MTEPTPLRPDEQVAGGFLVLQLGKAEHTLSVLPIRANREWKRQFGATLDAMVAGIGEPKTLEEVADSISGQIDQLLDALIAYDLKGVLPSREWIDDHATDGEVYTAIQKVNEAAFPLGTSLMQLALEQSATKVRRSLRSTNGSPPSTAGTSRRRKASKAA